MKKKQNFDFSKKLSKIIYFGDVLAQTLWFGDSLDVFWELAGLKTHFLAQGSIFWQKPTNEAKFSSKMSFLAWKNDMFDFWACA